MNDELLAPAIGAGLIEELTLSEYQNLKTKIMNALASYLRHIIVTGILIAVDKIGLPIEGASAAADIIALAVVGTVSWWVVKYLAPKIKMTKGGGTALLLLCGVLVLVLPSCSHLSGISGTLNIPLPERLGGGTIPITIHPAK